jgi:hypothetical protein
VVGFWSMNDVAGGVWYIENAEWLGMDHVEPV